MGFRTVIQQFCFLHMGAWVRGASPAFFLAGMLAVNSLGAIAAGQPGAERQAELVRLVRNDCGSCHGLTLAGGLGPALLPESLRGKPKEFLRESILHGRADTAMPPWAPFMTEAEAGWIVDQLMKGFPDVY